MAYDVMSEGSSHIYRSFSAFEWLEYPSVEMLIHTMGWLPMSWPNSCAWTMS